MEASEVLVEWGPVIVTVNLALVCLALVGAGALLARKPLTSGMPGARQNFGEWVLDFFVDSARRMGDRRVVGIVAPFLATLFLVIFLANMVAVIPIPVLNRPPTSFFGVTIGLALVAVGGTLAVNARVNGAGRTVKHLFWPNPMQLVSEITDVASLSLRLFGNIGGEYMTIVLVTAVVPFGIPLILHALGFIPAFIQAFVFTLLTTSFLASAIGHAEEHRSARSGPDAAETAAEGSGEKEVAS